MRLYLLLLCNIFLFARLAYAPPKDLENYNVVHGDLVNIPGGSYVQGSVDSGGTQPDYILDTQDPNIQRILRYARKVKNSDVSLWEKIDRINWYTRRYILPGHDYEDPNYTELITKYKKEKKDIPISEYLVCKAGVCRENALITHLMLKEAGIKNYHVYAKIHRSSVYHNYDIIEDHAFTVITVGKDHWVVDPYFWGFNGYLLKDLLKPQGITKRSRTAPIAQKGAGFRNIIQINTFPTVWIPKAAGAVDRMYVDDEKVSNYRCRSILTSIKGEFDTRP